MPILQSSVPIKKKPEKGKCPKHYIWDKEQQKCVQTPQGKLLKEMHDDPLYQALKKQYGDGPNLLGEPIGARQTLRTYGSDYFGAAAEWARFKGININPETMRLVGPPPGARLGTTRIDRREEAERDIQNVKAGPSPLRDVLEKRIKQNITESPTYRAGVRKALIGDESLYEELGGIGEEELRRRRMERLMNLRQPATEYLNFEPIGGGLGHSYEEEQY